MSDTERIEVIDHMTKDELITAGGKWLLAQGVSTVLLASILAFMAYDKVRLQPTRDAIQREAYKELQVQAQQFFDQAIERIERHNELWRQAILGRNGASLQYEMGKPFPYSDTLSKAD